MLNRRDVLKSIGLSAALGNLPSFAWAKTESDARFILVVLRGAVDGLALAAPFGDGNYYKVRGELAIPAPNSSDGLLKLDGLFGLHPSLSNVYQSFEAGDASIVHAIASPYRERSHFDGQDLLENGASRKGALRDGWLNRGAVAVRQPSWPRNCDCAGTKYPARPARRQLGYKLGTITAPGCRRQHARQAATSLRG